MKTARRNSDTLDTRPAIAHLVPSYNAIFLRQFRLIYWPLPREDTCVVRMFTTKCVTCKDAVGQGPQCSLCKNTYHFHCSGTTERRHGRLGTARDAWLCPSCRDSDPSVSLTNIAQGSPLPRDSVPQPSFASGVFEEPSPCSQPFEKNSDTPGPLPQDMLNDILSKVSAMQSQFSVIQSIKSDLSQVISDIAEMKSVLNAKLDELAGRVDKIESRVFSLEKFGAEIDDLKSAVRDIQESQRSSEQWVRRSNIQINGVPEKRGENLNHIVMTLANLSGFPLNVDQDIDFVTRVAVRNDSDTKKPKPIIVKLHSRHKKDDFITSLRKLLSLKASDLGFSNDNGRVYINDHLSSHNKSLLNKAKQKTKEKGYQYCWVRNCTIMVRRNEKSPIIYINSENALNKIA